MSDYKLTHQVDALRVYHGLGWHVNPARLDHAKAKSEFKRLPENQQNQSNYFRIVRARVNLSLLENSLDE